jgi:hypothetical protein
VRESPSFLDVPSASFSFSAFSLLAGETLDMVTKIGNRSDAT